MFYNQAWQLLFNSVENYRNLGYNPAELEKSLFSGIIYANPAKPEAKSDNLFRQSQLSGSNYLKTK
jgi:hypothetical protein